MGTAGVRAPESADDEALADGLIRLNSGLYGNVQSRFRLVAGNNESSRLEVDLGTPPTSAAQSRHSTAFHADVARTNFEHGGTGVSWESSIPVSTFTIRIFERLAAVPALPGTSTLRKVHL